MDMREIVFLYAEWCIGEGYIFDAFILKRPVIYWQLMRLEAIARYIAADFAGGADDA